MSIKNEHIFYEPVFEYSETSDFFEVDCCRACGEPEPNDVLSLGNVPLANNLHIDDQTDVLRLFPLSVFFCKKCTLLQLRQTVSNLVLFSHYPYLSSSSKTMLESSRACCERVITQKQLNPDSLVIEIGSNDGYLLKNYLDRGIPAAGIEPARNIADMANSNRIPTLPTFFDLPLAKRFAGCGTTADVVHANNVIAHIASVRENFEAIATILKDDGIAIIEVPYVKALLDNCWFDTIYHEHIFYFSLTSINNLAESAKLKVVDVEQLAIHGGSLRITVARHGSASKAVSQLLEDEKNWGVDQRETYEELKPRIDRLAAELRSLLDWLKQQGKKIAAYGASANGNIFLSVMEIGPRLEFVVDDSSIRQGAFTPGSELEILSPAALSEQSIDYTLLLVWNLKDEIIEQQKNYLKQGGSFIVSLPGLRIISFDAQKNSIVETTLSAPGAKKP